MKINNFLYLVLSVALVGTAMVASPASATGTDCNNTCVTPTPTPTSTGCTPQGCPVSNVAQGKLTQVQTIDSAKPIPATLWQNGQVDTVALLGSQASATSLSDGHQKISGGLPQTANQQQELVAGAAIEWRRNVWPSWTTAATQGSVTQAQSGSGTGQITSAETAKTEQQSFVKDDNLAKTKVAGQQNLVWQLDPQQGQKAEGVTQVSGWTLPSFPHSFTVGNVLRQIVTFEVQSIFSF